MHARCMATHFETLRPRFVAAYYLASGMPRLLAARSSQKAQLQQGVACQARREARAAAARPPHVVASSRDALRICGPPEIQVVQPDLRVFGRRLLPAETRQE